MFKNKYQFQSTHKFVTNPGETLVFDAYTNVQGEYTFHLQIQALQMSDEITVAILYRPAPNLTIQLYNSIPVPFERNAALWKFDVPICAGCEIKISQRGGIEKQAALHVWKRD